MNQTDPLEILAASGPLPPEQICRQVAGIFGVREDEVALLRLEGQFLRFLYPLPLDKVGAIPLSNSSSVAARTALLRKAELFNNFTAVKHASVFESVPLQPGEAAAPGAALRPAQILKLMSVPLICGHEVLGVLQVCRKANGIKADFTRENLERLVQVARPVVRMLQQSWASERAAEAGVPTTG